MEKERQVELLGKVDDIETLSALLIPLSDRQASIIQLRCGMAGNKVHTVKEIAKMYFVTETRVQQIIGQALKTLRRPELLRLYAPEGEN